MRREDFTATHSLQHLLKITKQLSSCCWTGGLPVT
ncbi:hypothetical protein CVT26_001667 [Gymnopilus dilepis]|uniref:Uncharacterized protein n=1 Tax=Gymnopilus dilepis TaxID=231916 RepID=A0A409WB51_9AGAR|nr:hypothetical protein CVT26_001667 [Gymnopilus dilepis]